MYWHTTGSFTTSRRLIILGPPLRFSRIFISLFIFFFLTGCKENKVHTNECYSSNQKSFMKTLCKKKWVIPTILTTSMYMHKFVSQSWLLSGLLLFGINMPRIWKMLLFEESWKLCNPYDLSVMIVSGTVWLLCDKLCYRKFATSCPTTAVLCFHFSSNQMRNLSVFLQIITPCSPNEFTCLAAAVHEA